MKCIAAAVLGTHTDAEDVVQQAYAIAITKNQKFPTLDKFLGWLAGIVKNCALNHRKKNRRRKTNPTDPTMLSELVEDHSEVISIATESNSNQSNTKLEDSFDDEVLKALNSLPEDARICILLRTVEKMSYKEISAYMAIPEGTAMSMVHRSRTKLRELLATHEFASSKGSSNE